MKYIDADLLRKEIEFAKFVYDNPKRVVHGVADAYMQDGRAAMCDDILKKIDSLQQEQPELPQIERSEYYYHKGVYEGLSQGRADALKMLDEFMKRNANPVIVIKQQEQPEVDLEKASRNVYESWMGGTMDDVRRDMVELGKALNARKKEKK